MRAAALLVLLVSFAGCRTSGSHCEDCPSGACDAPLWYGGCAAPCTEATIGGCIEYRSPEHTPVPPQGQPIPPVDESPRGDLPPELPVPQREDPPATIPSPTVAPVEPTSVEPTIRERVEQLGGRLVVDAEDRVTEIDLSGTEVTDADLRLLASASAIVELNLAGTSIGDAGLRNLPSLASLRILDLTGTRVGDAGLGELGRQPGLEFLLLSNTRLGAAGVDALSRLSALRGLDVEGATLAPGDLERLRTALPRCRIHGGEPAAAAEPAAPIRRIAERLADERFALALATTFEERGEWETVVDVLRPAAARPTSTVEVRHRLAMAHGRLGELDEARRLFEETVGSERAAYNIALLEYEANLHEARRRMATSLAATRLPQARAWIGHLERLERVGDVDTASGRRETSPRFATELREERPRVNLAIARPSDSDGEFTGLTIQPRGAEPIVDPFPLRPVPVPPTPVVERHREAVEATIERAVVEELPEAVRGEPIRIESTERTILPPQAEWKSGGGPGEVSASIAESGAALAEWEWTN